MAGRRTRGLVMAGVALACFGCHANSSYVYVDVSRALDSKPAPSAMVTQVNVKVPPPSSTEFKIAGASAIVEGRSTAEGAAKVKASIVANRDKTYRTIVRRLHDAYAREADNLRTQQLAAFEPVRAKTIATAMKLISEAYVKYADAVGPKIARLAVTAGFPDPDAQGRRKPSGVEGLDTLAYQTSQTLRAEIAALKANFKQYSAATIQSANTEADAKLTKLLADVDRQVGDIDARAQDVARREVSQAQAQLGTLLADRPPAPLPAIAESRVVVGTGTLPAPPARPVIKGAAGGSDDQDQVKQDLQVWLAVNRYVLRAKGRGRDATAEFIAWRNRFRLAPLTQP
ncbi:MAG: hypothetical protein ACYC96_13255 [Fimbriimonadaceae bacterium]